MRETKINKQKPVLYYQSDKYDAYIHWDWDDKNKPHELYVYHGSSLLYKYWFKDQYDRFFYKADDLHEFIEEVFDKVYGRVI